MDGEVRRAEVTGGDQPRTVPLQGEPVVCGPARSPSSYSSSFMRSVGAAIPRRSTGDVPPRRGHGSSRAPAEEGGPGSR
jgi:hypothetical protein